MVNPYNDYYVHKLYPYSETWKVHVLAIRKHGEPKEFNLENATGYVYFNIDSKCIEFHCDEQFEGLIMEYIVNNL